MRNKIWTGLVALLLTGGGLAVNMYLFRDVHPLGGVEMNLGRERILAIAGAIADSLGAARPKYSMTADIARSQDLIRHVHQRFGVSKGNALLRSTVHAYTWRVIWERPDESNLTIGSGGPARDQEKDIAGAATGKMEMGLDFNGGLTKLEIPLPDSVRLPSLDPADARLLADSFLSRYAPELRGTPGLRFSGEKRVQLAGRTDYEFAWEARDTLLGAPLRIRVHVDGNRIAALYADRELPADSQAKGRSTYIEIGIVILIAILVITMLVVGLKRIRSVEIGWRTGLILGAASAVLVAAEILYTMTSGLSAPFIAALVFGPSLYAGVLVLSWSIAESVGREAWREKFLTIDLLMHGHFLDSRVARGFLFGIATGAAANAVWTAAAGALAAVVPVWFNIEGDSTLKYLAYSSPAVYLLGHMATLQVLVISALCMFPMVILRRRIPSIAIVVTVIALFIALMGTTTTHPLVPGILVDAASIAVIVWALSRFDVLTAYVGFVTAATFDTLPLMLSSGDPSVLLSGEIVLGLAAASVVFGWVGLLTKDRVDDTDAIVPAFARHISERERMMHELQIARDVQMSLLPKETPRAAGLDIASRCVPALEVGGDYYDFIFPQSGKLGVVVGDVSGKGTVGAFYMTLAKGFLKAVARTSSSPAAVLKEANTLFYENVARGTFISIIYGLIDTKAGTVTIARAGHNPALLCRPGSQHPEVIQPKGFALGLEQGEKFSSTIGEVTLPFRPGDVLVLYTDGFIESTNTAGEQFGDDRFQRSAAGRAGKSAEDMIEGVLTEVSSFAGKATQHDDMTIVVVRRKE